MQTTNQDKTDTPTAGALISRLQNLKITREVTKLQGLCTAKDTYTALHTASQKLVQSRGGVYNPTEQYDACVYLTAKWLTEDPCKTGLMLMGTCGNGKTTLMRAVKLLFQKVGDGIGAKETNAKEVVELYTNDFEKFKKLKETKRLCIDEIGNEPKEILLYGNPLTPLVDLLEYRYDRQLITIATSNLTPNEMRKRYGERIADRFNEMMQNIIFRDTSFRGNNTQQPVTPTQQ